MGVNTVNGSVGSAVYAFVNSRTSSELVNRRGIGPKNVPHNDITDTFTLSSDSLIASLSNVPITSKIVSDHISMMDRLGYVITSDPFVPIKRKNDVSDYQRGARDSNNPYKNGFAYTSKGEPRK